jgi:hypothetical protein
MGGYKSHFFMDFTQGGLKWILAALDVTTEPIEQSRPRPFIFAVFQQQDLVLMGEKDKCAWDSLVAGLIQHFLHGFAL